ncbi:MAG: AarF/UbiB family protein [Myxococcales bacterium]|nr:AarF/UbiB family protein [Myxococcales bacterium]
MRSILLFFRAWYIVFVFLGALVRYLGAQLGGRCRSGSERDLLLGSTLAGALERLGATFVKFGQILATRPDLLPEGVIRGLARLQDSVPAAPFSVIEATLEAELGERRGRFREISKVPIAAASVAQVHRGVLDDGSVVAIKVQRPEAASQIEGDLLLMMLGARLIDLLPGMRYMSIPGAVEHFAEALRAQLNFRREAENNRILARNFAHDPKIGVPALYEDLCSDRVITMEFIDGIKPTDVQEDREGLAQAGFRCIAQMVFLDGFVHADMHPGNLMFTREGKVFLIDLGLVAEIPEDMRKPWCDTFLAVALGDGRRAAELFYGFAPRVDGTDYAAFEADIRAHLDALRGKPLHELEVTEAVGKAMAILRKHKVQVDPVFTVVNLAMLVAEGIGKQLDPHFDVYTCAMPFLAEAALRYPSGRSPLREIPRLPSPETETQLP